MATVIETTCDGCGKTRGVGQTWIDVKRDPNTYFRHLDICPKCWAEMIEKFDEIRKRNGK